jgi:hypothetical protein
VGSTRVRDGSIAWTAADIIITFIAYLDTLGVVDGSRP